MNAREKLRCCGIVIHTNRRKQFENAPDKLQWHPAFCAAAGLEFHEDIERLELKPEYNLSKEPIRIDLLIIKEGSTGQIKNEIGHIMRIYNVTEHLPFPAQIIVTQELEPGEHRSLRILSNHAKKEDIEEFLRNVEEMNTPRDRQNVEAVLQVSVKANDELYREIRRDANMCDALRELMKDDLEDARKLGESEGEAKIIINMNHSGMSPENIASITGKNLDEIRAILEGRVPVAL